MPKSLFDMEHDEQAVFLNGLALVCLIFRGPNRELCQELIKPEFAGEIMEFASLLDDDAIEAASLITGYLVEFKDADSLHMSLNEDYERLFNDLGGEAMAPLRHSYYVQGTGSMMRRPDEMMSLRLEAAGLDLEEIGAEAPDHLSVELEYLFLLFEEALSGANKIMKTEARAFVDKEMLPWLEIFESQLSELGENSFFSASASLLVAALMSAALMPAAA